MVSFPVYPWLHVQVKLPGVLVQLALESQVVASAHSSISDESPLFHMFGYLYTGESHRSVLLLLAIKVETH